MWVQVPLREPSNTPPTQVLEPPPQQLRRARLELLADPYPHISRTRWQPTTTITTTLYTTISTLTHLHHPRPHSSLLPPLCRRRPLQLCPLGAWSSRAAPMETTIHSTPRPTLMRQSTAAQAPHLRTACGSLCLLWASRHTRGRAAIAGTRPPSTVTWCRDASTVLVLIYLTSKTY